MLALVICRKQIQNLGFEKIYSSVTHCNKQTYNSIYISPSYQWPLDLPMYVGRVLPYLGMVGRFCSDDPCFWDFVYLIGSLFYALSQSSFCRKNQFQSNWPPFSLISDLFDHSFLQNLRSEWARSFIACRTRLRNIGWNAPPPPTNPCVRLGVSPYTNITHINYQVPTCNINQHVSNNYISANLTFIMASLN